MCAGLFSHGDSSLPRCACPGCFCNNCCQCRYLVWGLVFFFFWRGGLYQVYMHRYIFLSVSVHISYDREFCFIFQTSMWSVQTTLWGWHGGWMRNWCRMQLGSSLETAWRLSGRFCPLERGKHSSTTRFPSASSLKWYCGLRAATSVASTHLCALI